MKNKQYIIFDLDGTLADSFTIVANACKRVFARLAPTMMPADKYWNTLRSTDMEQKFSEMAEMAGMDLKDFRSMYDEEYAVDCTSGTKPIMQQYEKLKEARGKGFGIIVLTNKRQHIAEQVCSHLFSEGEIDIVIGREDTQPIKPRHVLSDRLHAHHIEPRAQCLMYYGDSDADYKSAELLCVPYTKV